MTDQMIPSPPKPWWWLSFRDPSGPPGGSFLGVCVVQGWNLPFACDAAHKLGINPGGEVLGVELGAEQLDSIPEKLRNRLLSAQELIDSGIGERNLQPMSVDRFIEMTGLVYDPVDGIIVFRNQPIPYHKKPFIVGWPVAEDVDPVAVLKEALELMRDSLHLVGHYSSAEDYHRDHPEMTDQEVAEGWECHEETAEQARNLLGDTLCEQLGEVDFA